MNCTGHSKSGAPCKRPATAGAVVCAAHGARAPQVMAKAAIRAEVMRWSLQDVADDPGQVVLRLLTQARRRADMYGLELERIAGLHETLQDALVGDSLITGADGRVHKAGEYVRAMVELEAQERDRAANLGFKCLAAGIEERRTRLAEREGAMVAEVFRAVFQNPELGLTAEQVSTARKLASMQLLKLDAGRAA